MKNYLIQKHLIIKVINSTANDKIGVIYAFVLKLFKC